MTASFDIRGPLLGPASALLAIESAAAEAAGRAGDSEALALPFFFTSPFFAFFVSRAATASLTRLVVPSA